MALGLKALIWSHYYSEEGTILLWDMRLSIACAATNVVPQPHHPSRQVNILNLPVVAQQPHPDPNYAPHTAARRVAVGALTRALHEP